MLVAILAAFWAIVGGAAESVELVDVDVLPATATHWAAVLQLSAEGFAASSVQLDGERFVVDITPAIWSGPSVRRASGRGVIAYRWAQFSAAPPTVRFVVEHEPGWSCSAAVGGGTVALSCSADAPSSATIRRASDGAASCEPVARVRGLDLCTPLRGLASAGILAGSLQYLPRDAVRDGLPHFGAARDDWKGAPRSHKGLDIYGDERDVLAMGGGEVADIGRGEKAGGWIKIAHGQGVETVYVHVRRIFVHVGEAVRAGRQIGRIDGPVGNAVEAQLHLEIRLDGAAVDPAPFFEDASPAELKAAWRRAIESVPERVRARQQALDAYGR